MTLNDSCLMSPIKTVSGVLVAGPGDAHRFRPDFPFCHDCRTHECGRRMASVLNEGLRRPEETHGDPETDRGGAAAGRRPAGAGGSWPRLSPPGSRPGTSCTKGLIAGMDVVGDEFRRHEIFLPDVLLAARAMYAGLDLLKPHLDEPGRARRGARS